MTRLEYMRKRKCLCCGLPLEDTGDVSISYNRKYCFDCSIRINSARSHNASAKRSLNGQLVCVMCNKLMTHISKDGLCKTCADRVREHTKYNEELYAQVDKSEFKTKYKYSKKVAKKMTYHPNAVPIEDTSPRKYKSVEEEGTGIRYRVECRGSGNFYCQ